MDDKIANTTRVFFFKHEGAENNKQQFLSVKRIKTTAFYLAKTQPAQMMHL